MKLTIQELIDAAHAAEANSTALFSAVGLLRCHEGNDKIIDMLREKGTRKHEQALGFEARYKARLEELLREAANGEPPLAKKIEWAADARMYKA